MNIEEQYLALLNKVLTTGNTKEDRTGTGTISKFGVFLEHDMSLGFPLLTTKEVHWKSVVTELMWMLGGHTDLWWLLKRDCNIWTGDAFKKYQKETKSNITKEEFKNYILNDPKFAKQFGEFGPIYGKKWRDFKGADQVSDMIDKLRNDPDSRRMLVSAWDPSDVHEAILPACHFSWQLYVRDGEYLSLHYNMRSNDLFLGAPFNIASYALLLCIIAAEVGMIPDKLSCSIGDAHIYLNHTDQVEEQLTRDLRPLPTLEIKNALPITEFPGAHNEDNFILSGYNPHPSIKAPLSN